MTSPIVSVIIPVWNGADRIAMTLDAISAQTAASNLFEVIVIDNGSTDATSEVVRRYPFVELLHEPQPGSYRARNLGLARAQGTFVLFTDGDCVPAPDWIEQAIDATSRDPDAGIWAGQIKLFREDDSGAFSARYQELTSFNQEHNGHSGFCVTANWLARRDMMLEAGGFNASLLSGGDVECSRRLVALGQRIAYAPDMKVGHPTRANLWELVRKRRRVVGGRWKVNKWSEKGVLWVARQFAREALGQARWVLKSDTKAWMKPGLVAIIAILLLAAYYELLRLAAGRPAYRS
jgi:glycosyltransferase involved in cell wall biosynthesis